MSSVDTVPILPDKGSKRADKVALTISIIALIVSYISLWDSHGAARVQSAAAMEHGTTAAVRRACADLLAELSKFYEVPACDIR